MAALRSAQSFHGAATHKRSAPVVLRRGEVIAHVNDISSLSEVVKAFGATEKCDSLNETSNLPGMLTQSAHTLHQMVACKLGSHCSSLRDAIYLLQKQRQVSPSIFKKLQQLNACTSMLRHTSQKWLEQLESDVEALLSHDELSTSCNSTGNSISECVSGDWSDTGGSEPKQGHFRDTPPGIPSSGDVASSSYSCAAMERYFIGEKDVQTQTEDRMDETACFPNAASCCDCSVDDLERHLQEFRDSWPSRCRDRADGCDIDETEYDFDHVASQFVHHQLGYSEEASSLSFLERRRCEELVHQYTITSSAYKTELAKLINTFDLSDGGYSADEQDIKNELPSLTDGDD